MKAQRLKFSRMLAEGFQLGHRRYRDTHDRMGRESPLVGFEDLGQDIRHVAFAASKLEQIGAFVDEILRHALAGFGVCACGVLWRGE